MSALPSLGVFHPRANTSIIAKSWLILAVFLQFRECPMLHESIHPWAEFESFGWKIK
ncbi:hypothetical protein VCHA37P192_280040 [Vibrio chagasii]|nr:hypothetical protein VCHA37P192_280040 [Vibrio chagasii]